MIPAKPMPTPDHHPINNETLAVALRSVGAPDSVINRLSPTTPLTPKAARKAKPKSTPQSEIDARQVFLTAARTPEDRQTLAASLGCTYAEVTQWAVRADLMRLPRVGARAAAVLEAAGVLGVNDISRIVQAEKPPVQPPAQSPDKPKQWLDALQEKTARLIEDPKSELSAAERRLLKAQLSKEGLRALGKDAAGFDPQLISETSVVLVVKGAGFQKADETLDLFINSFWPAVKRIDPEATISKRHDIFPSGYRSSARDDKPLNHVTEMVSGERRIWLKEPCWETALDPADPLGTLFNEWRLAAYAFARAVHDFFFVPDTRRREQPEYKKHNVWRYYAAFVTAYFFMFLHLAVTLFSAPSAWSFAPPRRILSSLGANLPFAAATLGMLTLAALLAACVAAILPASFTNKRLSAIKSDTVTLPGVSGLMVLLLMAAFLVSPATYLLWLLVAAALQLALLSARAAAWPYRAVRNSDTFIDHYYSIDGEFIEGTDRQKKIYKWDNGNKWLFARRLFIVLYRYLVVMLLPITAIFVALANVLKWTRVFGGIGEQLESALRLMLSSGLGDVVSYATDPAQAHRVRSVIACDIMFFSQRDDVTALHLFAHSQGTPITYETLFVHLPQKYRSKIKTYVTIGSVLSYYRQINPILDKFFQPRFPVRSYPPFHPDFKWINFWNLADPITEFYGLDEYNLVEKAPVLKLDPRTGQPVPIPLADSLHGTQRSPASPINIKTRATLDNHSEYWHNMEQVQIPFARRVLGHLRPPEWDQEELKPGRPHPQFVFWSWLRRAPLFLALLIVFIYAAGFIVGAAMPARDSLGQWVATVGEKTIQEQSDSIKIALIAARAIAAGQTARYWDQLLAAVSLLVLPTILIALLAHLRDFWIEIKDNPNKTRR